MDKILLSFVFLFFFHKMNSQNSIAQIIPQPVAIKQFNGTFQLKANSTIAYNNIAAQTIAEMFAAKLSIPTGFDFISKKGENSNIQLIINELPIEQQGDEGYFLEVNETHIQISANKPAGLFYGIQSLLQLLPKEIESNKKADANWQIPYIQITDYPRFAWRGLMLDVSRHFFTKEEVKKYISQMARYKLNTLHWHLTDDNGWRVEIKSLPKLTEIGAWRVKRYGQFGSRTLAQPNEKATDGGFYSQDDIKEIVRYATDNFVQILPEVDVPGHSMALLASYPELSTLKDKNTKVNPGTDFTEWYGNGKFKMLIENTLDPSNEKVYETMDKIFTEMAQLFPFQYFHVGGDECYKGFWENDKNCLALMQREKIKNIEGLQGYFMKRMEQILNKKGKKMIGWDEIMEGGITKETAVMSWRGTKYGIEAAKAGHYVVLSPTTYSYIDYQQGEQTIEAPVYASLRLKKSYSYEPVSDGIDVKYVLGGQGNLWTEQIPTMRYAEYMTYPRAWSISETFWSPSSEKCWKNFIEKVEVQFERCDIAKINYSKAIYDPIILISKSEERLKISMEMEAQNAEIFYTTDGTMPDNQSTLYTEPFILPEGNVTLRVVSYRNDKRLGNLIILTNKELKNRAE